MAFVYKIVRIGTDRCYVGHTIGKLAVKRWQRHKSELRGARHHSSRLQAAWNKHGENAFEFIVIEECDYALRLVREQYYMDTLNSCYNVADIAGSSNSEEGRAKISLAHKGKQWKLGYKLTPEQLERQWWHDPEKNKVAALKRVGSKRTDEQRLNMARAQQNNPLAGQHRVGFKETAAVTAKRLALAKAGLAAKPTIWVTDGKITKKIPANEPIPHGFQRGRTFSEQHKASILASAGPKTDETKAKMRSSRLRFLAKKTSSQSDVDVEGG